MLALVDGDIVAYRCAASAENDPPEVAIWRARDMMELMLAATQATEYQVWLSDKKENNFRYAIYPQYKANRTQPPPKHLQTVKEFLIADWQANVSTGQEADDSLGIEQMKGFFDDEKPHILNTIICSIDKDLLQIPGRHYNFVKNEFQEVTPLEGLKQFYRQLLIGDVSDNIFGIYGIGKAKAGYYINHLEKESHMFQVVRELYNDDARLLMNGKVLWIRQQQEQLWEFPVEPITNDDAVTDS